MSESIMDGRLSRESKGSSLVGLRKKVVGGAETTGRVIRRKEQVRDLTDFMNDMFFGTADMDKKTYDLNGGGGRASSKGFNNRNVMDDDEDYDYDDDDFGFDDSRRSNSARLTQGWLEEARRVLVSSPPGRFVGSPRFAAAAAAPSQGPRSPLMALDRRDPLSRSARRNKAGEGLGEEILSKSSKLSRNKSDILTVTPPLSPSPSSSPSHAHGSSAATPHLCFCSSNPNNNNNNPPRPRKSRFQAQAQAQAQAHAQPNSSPHLAQQTPPRRSFSNSLPLSPPRHPVESSHRRSRSSSTCSLEVIADSIANGILDHSSLNGFLKNQRASLLKILNVGLANVNVTVTVVLSGHSNSAASMVAAICHAWLLSYRLREEKGAAVAVVVPVMNIKRGAMWKLRQAAWLFHLAGLDATALLFSDEVHLEKLMMTGQMRVLVVGQDVLCATGEVGSQCTILTDNFCEDAYDLLQDPVLKKLLLGGILLDTQNLKASASITMTRDSEAVQLLLVGSAPNDRHALFDQLMQEQKGGSFVEVLNSNYGKLPDEGKNSEENMAHKIGERITTSKSNGAKTDKISPKSAKVNSAPGEKDSSRPKKTFFLAKWFGFSSK